MKLWLVRHGETEFNREKRCQGFTDTELNETGIAQAKAVAEALKSKKITAVFASPLKRASLTASFLAKDIGVEVKPEPGLMELNQGVFEGATMDDMMRTHPDVLKEWISNPADVVLPGGESMRQLAGRAWKAIETIKSLVPKDARVLAVSHNLAICAILCCALGLDVNYFRRFKLTPGGISLIEFTPFGTSLAMVNSTGHLDNI